MKSAIALCASLLILAILSSSAAYGTAFVWNSGTVQYYDGSATYWTPNGIPGRKTLAQATIGYGDNMTIGNGVNMKWNNPSSDISLYIGALTCTSAVLQRAASGPVVWIYTAGDNLTSRSTGDLTIIGSGALTTAAIATNYGFTVKGNYRLWSGALSSTGTFFTNSSLTMTGIGKILEDNTGSYIPTVTIAAGASISTGPGNPRRLDTGHTVRVGGYGTVNSVSGSGFTLNGAFSGDVSTCRDTMSAWTGDKTYAIVMGPGAQWTSGTLYLGQPYNGTGVYKAITTISGAPGTSFYDIDLLGATGNNGANQYLYPHKSPTTGKNIFVRRQMTDITCHNWTATDNTADVGSIAAGNWTNNYWDTDCGAGVYFNLHVTGNMTLGGDTQNAAATVPIYNGIVAHSSTITVDGNALFDRFGYVRGAAPVAPAPASGTWNFGGNVQFTSFFRYDNSNMSQATVNLVGAGRVSANFNNKLKLGNLYVNPTGAGTHVHLTSDNALLYGNFGVLGANSGFNMDCSASWLLFRGGQGTADTAQTIEIDNSQVTLRKLWVQTGSPTWVKLLSDLTVTDNLDIDSGCELLLNGHTLTVQGMFPGTYAGANTWTVRGGGLVVGSVPEPATLMLLGSGALGALGYIRRRRMTSSLPEKS